jgi:hypothetical protein
MWSNAATSPATPNNADTSTGTVMAHGRRARTLAVDGLGWSLWVLSMMSSCG